MTPAYRDALYVCESRGWCLPCDAPASPYDPSIPPVRLAAVLAPPAELRSVQVLEYNREAGPRLLLHVRHHDPEPAPEATP